MIVETGTDVLSFWEAVALSRPDISSFAVASFTKQPQIQQRIPFYSEEQAAISAAQVLNRSLRLPFLDAVILEAVKCDVLTNRLLDEMTNSNPVSFERRYLERSEVTDGAIREVVTEGVARGEIVVILSEVVSVLGSKLHFPMLDLRCEPNDSGLRFARSIAGRLLPGANAILHSGGSFHLVGTCPVSHEQLQGILHNSLFYGPLVDRHYVAHHLRHRVCSLRVSPSKEGSLPALAEDAQLNIY